MGARVSHALIQQGLFCGDFAEQVLLGTMIQDECQPCICSIICFFMCPEIRSGNFHSGFINLIRKFLAKEVQPYSFMFQMCSFTEVTN